MESMAIFIIARIFIASVFVGLGLERLLTAIGILGQGGAPASAGALAFSALELIAGLLVMIGWQVRWVASLLAVFLLVDAFISHPFWRYAGAEQHGQLLHYLKNMSSIGGLLLLAWLDFTQELGAASKSAGAN